MSAGGSLLVNVCWGMAVKWLAEMDRLLLVDTAHYAAESAADDCFHQEHPDDGAKHHKSS